MALDRRELHRQLVPSRVRSKRMLQMIFAAAALAIYWNSAGIARNPTSDFTGADLVTVCSRADRT
jgi:hypothetical protein